MYLFSTFTFVVFAIQRLLYKAAFVFFLICPLQKLVKVIDELSTTPLCYKCRLSKFELVITIH